MNHQSHLVNVLACAAVLLSTAAQGQGIWRCGPQGNSFSDRPCADGQTLSAAPAPSAAAVREAAEVARREAALADRLRAQRLAQEREFAQALAVERRGAQRAFKSHRPRHAASETAPDAGASQRSRSGDKALKATGPGLRVAAAPGSLSPKARPPVGPSATAGARTSPAIGRGFPPSRD